MCLSAITSLLKQLKETMITMFVSNNPMDFITNECFCSCSNILCVFCPQESPHGDGSGKEDGDNKDKELASPECPPEMESDLEDNRNSPCPDDDIIPDSDDEIDVENEPGST